MVAQKTFTLAMVVTDPFAVVDDDYHSDNAVVDVVVQRWWVHFHCIQS